MDPQEKLAAEIFDQAAVMENVEARDAYVRGACRGNEQLYQRVQELLASYASATDLSFLKTTENANEALTLDDKPLSEGPGTVIGPVDELRAGRYKLLQKIGEGGMGVVYMAEQNEPVKRKVALKIIKLGMDTKHVVARFEAERQALAMMDHPNIARVLDGGSTETGRPFFVMELVKGVPITEFCDKNKLTPKDRLKLFMQVCKAIQSAHQKGIIHRDIKPTNILVTLHHGDPLPKVIDFGIAKATNQKLTEKTLFTNYAQLIGTPAYMSPEQAEMSTMDVDTRSDVYSLGVLLYELLTGTTPFPEKELLSQGYGEMQRIITEKEPDRPSYRMSTMQGEQQALITRNRSGDTSILARQFKGDLDLIVMKSLEKDRNRRYETANSLAEDVQRHLENQPILAAAPTVTYQFKKFLKRQQKWISKPAAVAMFTLIFLGFIIAAFQMQKANRAREMAARAHYEARQETLKANEAEDRADKETVKADQIAQFMIDQLEQTVPELIRQGNVDDAKKILERANLLASEHLSETPHAELNLRRVIARIYHWQMAETDEAVKQGHFIRNIITENRVNLEPDIVRDHLLEIFMSEIWASDTRQKDETIQKRSQEFETWLEEVIQSDAPLSPAFQICLTSLWRYYRESKQMEEQNRLADLMENLVIANRIPWSLDGNTGRFVENLMIGGRMDAFFTMMDRFPGSPSTPNWRFAEQMIGLLQEWTDQSPVIPETRRLNIDHLNQIAAEWKSNNWPAHYFHSMEILKARILAIERKTQQALEKALEVGLAKDVSFDDWMHATELVNLFGNKEEQIKMAKYGEFNFASRVGNQYIFRLIRTLNYRPTTDSILETTSRLIDKFEKSYYEGTITWAHYSLPNLKALQCYREGDYIACLEHLDSNPFGKIENLAHQNLFFRWKKNPTWLKLRFMAHAQLGQRKEALEAYESTISSLLNLEDWTVNLIEYRLDEGLTLLREKGYLNE